MPSAAKPVDTDVAHQAEGRSGLRELLGTLGPGFISGASDNDPTTVGTLAVVGATTRYGLSWLVLFLLPMLASVQIISARVGIVTHRSLQEVVRGRYRLVAAQVLLVSVLAVNLITIGADLEAGAAALGLLIPVAWRLFVAPYALVLLALLVFGTYRKIERVLSYVLLVFVVYVAAAVLAHPNWGTVLRDTVVPHLSLSKTYVEGALSLLGTTLTSYAYVWETIEQSEKRLHVERLGLAQADAGVGMIAAVAIFWFILIATAATLGVHHQSVQTAQDAARALQPAAGRLASALFGVGLLASSVLAQQLHWRSGLSERFHRARPFYLAVGVALLLAVGIALAGVSAIDLLFWAGIAGGLGTPISLAFLLSVARDRTVMGERRIGPLLLVLGWGTALVVSAASLYFLWQTLAGLI
jgi:Mn2+/Fe2+ NRAMP family transporter